MATQHWARDMAVDLLRQGYTKEHAAAVTGLTVRQIAAIARPDAGPTLRELVEVSLERPVERSAPVAKKRVTKKRTPAKKRATATRKKRAKAATRKPRLEVVADNSGDAAATA